MRELICSLPKEYGMTVMVSSHLLSEIDQIATDVGIISKGELTFQDSLAALHKENSHNIAIRTLDNVKALELLSGGGMHCHIQDDFLLLPEVNDDELAGLVRRFFEKNIGVVRIEDRCKSLEDIFLDLTGSAVSL